MKLLLISSEPLNPDSILTSTFELTQAVLLSRIAAVAIVSVGIPRSLPAETRQLISGRKKFAKYTSFLATLIGGKQRVSRYRIEGIPVYEGSNFKYYSKSSWEGELKDWISAGYAAFLDYVQENGYPDFVHAHGRFISAGALALEIKKKKAVSFFYTEHSTVYQAGTAPAVAKKVLGDIIRAASGVIAVSEALRGQMESFLGTDLPQVTIQPNVLDPVFEELLPEKKRTEPAEFICVASLHEKKGLKILLGAFHDAFGSDEKYRLSVCGEGPQRTELEKLVAEMGLTRQVVFTGNLSKVEIRDSIDRSHVLVLSSLHETFGVAVIEALARGCPVIATRSGGPEFIVGENDGMLVESGSAGSLAAAMKQMIAGYSIYQRLPIRERALARFGSAAFIQRALRLYTTAENKSA